MPRCAKMEEDLEILERAILKLEATGEDKSEQNGSHRDLYKNWGKYGSQEQRRKELLETQKSNRLNRIDKFRGIMELVQTVEEGKLFKPYKKITYRPSIYVAGFHKTCLTYSNVLMLSEWMVEKPDDFETDWYIAPCPKGSRMLVISYHGMTKCYNKYGHFKFEYWSALPGGNPRTAVRHNSCVLDCFYYKPTNTMYVLDILAWNAQPMTDGETEFRQFWMKSHLDEISGLKTVSKWNRTVFKLIPMIPCTTHELNTFFSKYPPCEDPEFPPLDGLLFYHKKAHYFAGQTPLVGWLFPFMVPEVIGGDIKVNPEYFEGRPDDYVNQSDFIQKFEYNMALKKDQTRRNSRKNSMDLDTNKNEVTEDTKQKQVEPADVMESEETIKSVEGLENMEKCDQPEKQMESEHSDGLKV
ncbi:snurportin-1 isoform X1 [Zerene cesonia]|uniref:snurportin-1 isoform X1 n=2 Tax=Zerene cesonia TaxID=33412 RepID=UPI0018E51D93|nr:snurportin-1 isoform X1 [Zerene cesonia]XP_038208164.1 snurportin-1 isoform X1 [Zerene cesonia]XP_038208165.1 snurportin-1 isoform X1 [Zerene cesonia]